jgi:hypothetical protein
MPHVSSDGVLFGGLAVPVQAVTRVGVRSDQRGIRNGSVLPWTEGSMIRSATNQLPPCLTPDAPGGRCRCSCVAALAAVRR